MYIEIINEEFDPWQKLVEYKRSQLKEKNNIGDDERNFAKNENNEEEYTPKLFSEEQSSHPEVHNFENNDQTINEDTEQLFNQDINEEEDFEIPAFLRKQKF